MANFPERKIEMSEEEMGRIALAYVRAKARRGVHINSQVMREIGEMAKQSGVDFKRARLFAEIMVRELVEEAFADSK